MKIAVIAADGRSGRVFVETALAAGHEVRAGVYHANPFDDHPTLEVLQCDATRPENIIELIKGCDAVVSLIGHARKSNPRVQTIAIQNCLEAMRSQKIDRIVSLTGTGVRLDGDRIPMIDRVMNMAIARIDPGRISDGKSHAELLQGSDANYTIIRVLKLSDGQPSDYKLKPNGPAKLLTPRAEVAQGIMEVLENHSFVRAMPVIGAS